MFRLDEQIQNKIREIERKLAEPFPPENIEWRVSRSFKAKNGKPMAFVVPYIESRAVMNRLDDVVGINNWENEFKTIHNGIICGIRIWFSDTVSRIKWDGADLSDYEPTKGGLSNALKRAAVHWGIGRYLYSLPEYCVEIFPDRRPGSNFINDRKNKIVGYWDAPNLPEWALPKNYKPSHNTTNNTRHANRQNQGQSLNPQQMQAGREQMLKYIHEFEQIVQLKDNHDYIVRIFNKANNTNIQNVSYIAQQASPEELTRYYNALKPVRDICLISRKYNCPMEQILYFIQILKPENLINNLYSTFFLLNNEDIKKIIEMAKQYAEQNVQTA